MAQGAIWLNQLAKEVLQTESVLMIIYYNNQSIIKSVKSEETAFNMQTKHLDLQKDFVHYYIQNRYINVHYVQT